jgi:hypothetical protein
MLPVLFLQLPPSVSRCPGGADGPVCLCLQFDLSCVCICVEGLASTMLLTLMDCTRLRSSSETGGSDGRNERIAATIGGTFMAGYSCICGI